MLKIPAFKKNLHLEIISGEGVLILYEKGANVLYGISYEQVIPLINGQRSTSEIVDALEGHVDAARVFFVIGTMESKGYLIEAIPIVSDESAAFWHGVDINPAIAVDALQNKRVAVLTAGPLDSSLMLSALDDMGVQVTERAQADLWMVLTNDYLQSDLAEINKSALLENRPWLLVRLSGPELWLGPIFQPAMTGCWLCLSQRLKRNRAVHRFITEKKNLSSPPLTALGSIPASRAATCHMAALVAAQFLVGVATGLVGKVLSINWATHETQLHNLGRQPNCPACGTTHVAVAQPIQLQPCKASFVRDGGHRSVPPEQTLKNFMHLVSPITGVVRMLQPVREDKGIAHVYLAGHNHAAKINKLVHLQKGLRNMSCGKGVSETQAKVSALCEAIERYSGELMGGEIRVNKAFDDWPVGEAFHPNSIMNFSMKQFLERAEINKKGSRFNSVPEPLIGTTPVDWTPLWSLTDQRHKYLPTQLVYYNAPASEVDKTQYAQGCSNGNASGNTLEEAILQGFFELVERDSVALWWYNRLRRPAVVVDSFGEPYLLELQEHLRHNLGREIWALDLTSDLGIPVFVAVSRLIAGPEERLLFGLGCHLDARIALQRAYAEMNQMVAMAHNDSDGELSLDDAETLSWLKNATLANQPYLVADRTLPPKRFSDYPLQHSGDFLQDINRCRSIVEAHGMEMLVLDQTRSDVGMPVVKVVVPGLRHFWARFAPGRLYDVPVKMGWLQKPLREEDLNPTPVFF